MISGFIDRLLTRLAVRFARTIDSPSLPTRRINTPVGPVRVYDSQTAKPCVIFVADGPNVIEHYAGLIALLSERLRVVCFDMPGFGHSLPLASYQHSLDQGAQAILGVLDALQIERASLAFSCANGFYALRLAQLAPQRVQHLVLSQTPSLLAMHNWVQRIIPWPLRIPVLGQICAWLFRRKAAHSWYRIALARNTSPEPFRAKAHAALASGGCFCLAGVVQGLSRADQASLAGVTTPCTIIWGTQDRSHRQTDPESLLELVPHAELVVFDDSGHFPDLEQPERFAALLLGKVEGSE